MNRMNQAGQPEANRRWMLRRTVMTLFATVDEVLRLIRVHLEDDGRYEPLVEEIHHLQLAVTKVSDTAGRDLTV